ncbi:MAG: hypothetical protein GYA55_04755, partial [SAR324 cluster bacterium]|nr:hypothetical protein [SAR324 cluster bacterium]
LESEKDATTDHEQIKRGSGKDAGIPGSKISKQFMENSKNTAVTQESKKQPNIEERATKAEASQGADKARERAQGDEFSTSKPLLRQLKLEEGAVFEKFALNQKPQSLNEKLKGAQNSPDMSAYQPFSRPSGSGARFLGDSGITDYLPNLPDGDITLLNTKANKFAVFVSRVATQVFSQMRAGGLESISTQEILKASDFNVVRARLSLKGELLSLIVEKSSGSKRFDDILLSSARLGAKDPNPPADAASSDGSIQFIFQSRIWGEISSSPRSGMPFRRIWLLLATGLE